MAPASTPVAAAAGRPTTPPARSSVSGSAPTRDLDLGALFAYARDAIVVGNLDTGRIAAWNPAAEHLFGYTAVEAIGQPISMLIPPAIARLHTTAFEHFRRAHQGSIVGSDRPIEVPALTRSGEEIRVELSLVPLEGQSASTSYVLAMLRDVTDRRRADRHAIEAARANAARTASEARLHHVSQLVHDGLTELATSVARLERSARRLGGDAEPALSDPRAAKAAGSSTGATPGTASPAGHTADSGVATELRDVAGSGSADAAGAASDAGHADGAAHSGRTADAGGPLHAAGAAQAAEPQAIALAAEQGHGYPIEPLSFAQQAHEAQRMWRRVMVVQLRARAIQRELSRLADRAALESGTLRLTPERVNLVPLLGRIVAEFRQRAPRHRFKLGMPQGLTAMADPQRIEQVVTALVEQAVQRNPRGCWIDIDLKRPLVGQARLEVRDYGRSMPEPQRGRLLEPGGGGGIPSLWIAKAIIEQHGGTLSIEHALDAGVRLVVTLPAQRRVVQP